jgi:hypothetical protein
MISIKEANTSENKQKKRKNKCNYNHRPGMLKLTTSNKLFPLRYLDIKTLIN